VAKPGFEIGKVHANRDAICVQEVGNTANF
jgi:hypothetical protein